MSAEQFPSRMDLVKLWLVTHYPRRACVVFFGMDDPDCQSAVRHRFTEFEWHDMINADIAVLTCGTLSAALRICDETPRARPYAVVWDGARVVHENV